MASNEVNRDAGAKHAGLLRRGNSMNYLLFTDETAYSNKS